MRLRRNQRKPRSQLLLLLLLKPAKVLKLISREQVNSRKLPVSFFQIMEFCFTFVGQFVSLNGNDLGVDNSGSSGAFFEILLSHS